MVSERDIEVDLVKIRAILDMPASRTEREIHHQIDRHREPIFRLLRKSQPTIWDDQCQGAFERIRRPTLVDCLMRWLVLLTKFDIHYVTHKSIRGSIVADHLASLPVSDGRAIDDDFPDEDVASVTSLSGWRMYFDSATNYSGYGIGVLLISLHGDHIPKSVRLAFLDRHPATNNIVEYEACILGLETTLELGIRQVEVYSGFVIDIPAYTIVRPLLIESRSVPAYCCLIDDVELDDGLPWYHDIYQFLRLGAYPKAATTKDKRALRQLDARFVICGGTTDDHLMGCYYYA
ncbi:hypothetical protein AAG906_013050 [Vitis piasezkii]